VRHATGEELVVAALGRSRASDLGACRRRVESESWRGGDRRWGAGGRDGGLGIGDAAQRVGGATGGESRERCSRSVPQALGRSRHGVAAARERDGVTGGVEVRVTIFDVVYILCLLG
jgi:hypothetical protein